MPQKHARSQSRKNHYAQYKSKGTYASNKQAKLKRHLRKFPNDETAKKALAEISSTPKRGTPKGKMWSAKTRYIAQLFASVGINGLHSLNNAKVSARIDDEHLRFDAQHKEGLMKRDKKKK